MRGPEDVLFRAQTEHASMYSRTSDFMEGHQNRLGNHIHSASDPRPTARPVGKSETETIKEQSPPGLTRIKSLSLPDVLQIFVVCPHHKWMHGPFQPMSPLL